MTAALRNKSNRRNGITRAERLARELGGRPFDLEEMPADPSISDEELEKFLKLRNDMRKGEREASRDCLP
jgi:hypothetical protein